MSQNPHYSCGHRVIGQIISTHCLQLNVDNKTLETEEISLEFVYAGSHTPIVVIL